MLRLNLGFRVVVLGMVLGFAAPMAMAKAPYLNKGELQGLQLGQPRPVAEAVLTGMSAAGSLECTPLADRAKPADLCKRVQLVGQNFLDHPVQAIEVVFQEGILNEIYLRMYAVGEQENKIIFKDLKRKFASDMKYWDARPETRYMHFVKGQYKGAVHILPLSDGNTLYTAALTLYK